jgi:hypothetical protein
MATTTSPELVSTRTTMPRTTVVAATTFLLAGTLRLTAGAEQFGLSLGFAVFFFTVAAAQIGYGVWLSAGSRRALSTPVATAAMIISLGFVGLWLIATTATVPIYPLMTGGFAVDVFDLGTALLELVGVVALCRSLPQPTRRRVALTLVGLVAVAWMVWVVIIVSNGLHN